jgi:hypothetical protein
MESGITAGKIDELTKGMGEMGAIISKYVDKPSLYENTVKAQNDMVKVSAALVNINSWVGLASAELENLTNSRKAEKSRLMRELMTKVDQTSGKPYSAAQAEHEARTRMEDYDKRIASVRTLTEYGRAFVTSASLFLTTVKQAIRNRIDEARIHSSGPNQA